MMKNPRLTDFLIEEKIYGSLTRKAVISRILPTVFPFPSYCWTLLTVMHRNYNLIEVWLINQIETFIDE